MTPDELRAEVARINWWHSIDLGQGIVTPGRTNLPDKVGYIGLPDDLTGRSILDVGAWDGLLSFEAERRGAQRVVAVDSFCWNGPGWGTKAGFDLARRSLGSKVEDREIEVVDLSPDTVGVFDVVLFLGVLYHLTDPLRALQSIFSVTGSHLIMETHVDLTAWPTHGAERSGAERLANVRAGRRSRGRSLTGDHTGPRRGRSVSTSRARPAGSPEPTGL